MFRTLNNNNNNKLRNIQQYSKYVPVITDSNYKYLNTKKHKYVQVPTDGQIKCSKLMFGIIKTKNRVSK